MKFFVPRFCKMVLTFGKSGDILIEVLRKTAKKHEKQKSLKSFKKVVDNGFTV